jgi:hypothetical protein
MNNEFSLKELQDKMLFACIWSEKEKGGYNRFDALPFIALNKITDKETYYQGVYLKIKRDKRGIGKVYFDEKLVDKPLNQFNSDGDDRIFISNDINEICNLFLKRYEN